MTIVPMSGDELAIVVNRGEARTLENLFDFYARARTGRGDARDVQRWRGYSLFFGDALDAVGQIRDWLRKG